MKTSSLSMRPNQTYSFGTLIKQLQLKEREPQRNSQFIGQFDSVVAEKINSK